MAAVAGRLKKGSAALAIVIALVGGFEGLRTVAYLDPVNIPTICFGETRGVKLGDTATERQCEAMLGNRLVEFSVGVDRCLIVRVADKVYAAFVSLAYNIGVAAFCGSTVLRRANAGQLLAACDAMLMWTKATLAGVRLELPGLVARRQAERELCRQGALA
jgi:lysozyme